LLAVRNSFSYNPLMSSVLEVSQETAVLIESYARHAGVSVEEYIRALMPSSGDLGLRANDIEADFDVDMASLADDSAQDFAYSGSYSREDIYADHN